MSNQFSEQHQAATTVQLIALLWEIIFECFNIKCNIKHDFFFFKQGEEGE